MVVRINNAYVRFVRVKSPRYVIRSGFEVFRADTMAEVHTILEDFLSKEQALSAEVIELLSVQRPVSHVPAVLD